MAKLHCRYCGGADDHETGAGFATLTAYDDHLIVYKDMEKPPYPPLNGRPVCIGQKWGRAIIDPNLIRMRAEVEGRLHGAVSASALEQAPP